MTLETTGRNGQTVSPTEYLKTKVLCGSKRLIPTDAADMVSMAIMNYFPSVECMTLPPPSSDAEVMRDIVNNEQHLSKQFNKGVADVVAFVCQRVKAKHAFKAGCSVDGPTLAALTEQYAEAINTHNCIPCLDNTWNTVVKLRVKTTMDKLTEEYEKEMEAATEGKLPMEEGTIEINQHDVLSTAVYAPSTLFEVHQSIWPSISKRFLAQIEHLTPPEDASKMVNELEKRIVDYKKERSSENEATIYKVVAGCALSKFMRLNDQKSQEHCRQLITYLYNPVLEKLNAASSSTHNPAEVHYTFEDLRIELQGLHNKYFAEAVGPAKQSVYTNKHLEIEGKMKALKDIEVYRAESSKAEKQQYKAEETTKRIVEEHAKHQKELKTEKIASQNQIRCMKRETAAEIEKVQGETKTEMRTKLHDQEIKFQAYMETAEKEREEQQEALIQELDDKVNKLKQKHEAVLADGKTQRQKQLRFLNGQCTECGLKTKDVIEDGRWKGACFR